MSQLRVTRHNQTIRVFIAAPIPSPAKLVLSKVIEGLRGEIPEGVRWVNAEGIHLTIKFLGNVPSNGVARITEAMGRAAAEVSPFQVRLWGLGTFPNAPYPNNKGPRVLWAGLEGEVDRLRELQEKSESALEALGYPIDRRPFNPHLTLGRVRDQANEQTRRGIGSGISSTEFSEELEASEPWPVESVELIQTHFGDEGATYTTLVSAPLKDVLD